MTAGWLDADRTLGRLLRLPLAAIPRGAPVPILATHARGKRWIAGSGPHSCWLGFNERSKRRRFALDVRSGDVVYDIGANVGSYTILASVLVGPQGRVVAFEPVAENVRYLKQHIHLNRLRNVDVVEAAVGEASGTARFEPHPDRLQGRIDAGGTQLVAVVSLDDLLREGKTPAPDCLKIDVEGGEVSVLEGAADLLRSVRPVVFLATHGPAALEASLDLLTGAGYEVTGIGRGGDEWVAGPLRDARMDPTPSHGNAG
jgi:FkbM family methyltransferase